jgi:hypothetical protein
MLANIKADLNSRILGSRKISADDESSQPLDIESSAVYEAELKQELEGKMAALQFAWGTGRKDRSDTRESQSRFDSDMIDGSQDVGQCSQQVDSGEGDEEELTRVDQAEMVGETESGQ